MNGLIKLGLGAGIAYIIYEAVQTQMQNQTATAASTDAVLTPNYQLTAPVTTIFPPIKISPDAQAGINALDKAAEQPTDAELAQQFGWSGGAASFVDWVDQIHTQTELDRL